MLVREIMTSPALSVAEDSLIEEAVGLMATRRLTSLPVVNAADDIVGILSEMDILRCAVPHDARASLKPMQDDEPPAPVRVHEIMTHNPRTTCEGRDVADLVHIFTSTSIKSIPVVRGHKLVGVVSRSDVIRALWRSDEELLTELRAVFAECGQTQWDVTVEHAIVTIAGEGTARQRDSAAALARSVMGVRRVRLADPVDPGA